MTWTGEGWRHDDGRLMTFAERMTSLRRAAVLTREFGIGCGMRWPNPCPRNSPGAGDREVFVWLWPGDNGWN